MNNRTDASQRKYKIKKINNNRTDASQRKYKIKTEQMHLRKI